MYDQWVTLQPATGVHILVCVARANHNRLPSGLKVMDKSLAILIVNHQLSLAMQRSELHDGVAYNMQYFCRSSYVHRDCDLTVPVGYLVPCFDREYAVTKTVHNAARLTGKRIAQYQIGR